MGFGIAVFMILCGIALAVFMLVAWGLHVADTTREGAPVRESPTRDGIAASIIAQVTRLGGAGEAEALSLVREHGGIVAPIVRGIDISSWAAQFSRVASAAQREWLLDAAVRAAVASSSSIPLLQYEALLDLSFGLGFQTDALARLRARYRFEYVDHAKHGRPREADRAAAVTLAHRPGRREELLSVLELEGRPERHEVISAYRRLAARWHPDRFHEAPEGARREASEQFIRLTEAYEELLSGHED